MTTNNSHPFFELPTHHIEQTDHIFIIDEPTVDQEQLHIISGFGHRGRWYFIDYSC